MPVDKRLLESCIQEAFGGDDELVALAQKKYAENDKLAVQFVGGFTRTQDYTQKTQALATDRQKVEQQAQQYQTALEQSETEKNAILKKLATSNMTVAQARQALQNVKDTYQLSDDDIPGMSDLITTAKTGQVVDSTPDLDTRFSQFEDRLMKSFEKKFVGDLSPELSAMATLPLIWNDVNSQHQELTGKRLTFEEQQKILEAARKESKSIRQVWEDQHGIGEIRLTKRDEATEKRVRDTIAAEEAEKRSQQAMGVIRPQQTEQNDAGISRAFKKQFKTYDQDPMEQTQSVRSGEPTRDGRQNSNSNERRMPSAADRQGLRGAEKAAQKFLAKGGTAALGKKAAEPVRQSA